MIEALRATELFAALAHKTRLEAFRILVRAGPDGVCAGTLARQIGLSPTAASFHFNRMRQSGLVHRHRAGQQLIYTAEFGLMKELIQFLDAECCADTATGCGPQCAGSASPDRRSATTVAIKEEV
jgi:DNA-binding transcriptional ArsR family regulator